MVALFDVEVPATNKHPKNIFDEGELQKGLTVSKLEIVQTEGTRQVKRNRALHILQQFKMREVHYGYIKKRLETVSGTY